MSKISTYSLADEPLQLSDRLIGTEAPRPIPSSTPLATKNFSLGELLQLFSSNFPAATLQAVLDSGNIATQNIDLTGRIDVTLIKPVNIEDMLGSEGTPLQILSKGVGGISWIDQPTIATPTLQQVVTQGRVYNEVGSFNQYDFEVFSGTDGIASSKTLFSRIRNIANTIVSTFSFSRSLTYGTSLYNA